ncbi:3-hydroxyacyl-CoA dehydrogenase NAD-binding domain-containing protein, partial [Streptomyces hoynatensis]
MTGTAQETAPRAAGGPPAGEPAGSPGPAASPIRWERDAEGVVTLTLDAPGSPVNLMDAAFAAALAEVAGRLGAEAEAGTLRGVLVTSAKRSFFAGADLRELRAAGPGDAAEVFAAAQRVKGALRRIETLGVPVVAALNGSALGGGLEIALACHRRIALDAPGSRFGLPEVTLGLLPGGGGVTRTVRLLGIAEALLQVLLEGATFPPARALELGLVHEVVPDEAELLRRARAFIAENPRAAQPWDLPGHRIPGGTPADARFAGELPTFPALLRKRTGGAPAPAPRNILAAAVEGAQVDVETALTIESRHFTEVATGQVSTNMIQGFFFDLRRVRSGAARPAGQPERRARRVAVLGAGMMGAGIAHACAVAGAEVVLKDVTREAAERGRRHAERLLERAVAAGRATQEEGEAALARITPTAETAELSGCDVVIEAVYEDPGLKHKVFQEVQEVVAPGALLCSNTSTLPITELAGAVDRPADFLGLHFFSPVHRMPLIEVIRGAHTSEAALARAFDLAAQLGKTPILVNDSRGFFTSRVIGRYLSEGIAMVGEGVPAASVEQAAAQAGYPTPVLALADELTLGLPRRIWAAERAAAEAAGTPWRPEPAQAVVDRMLDEFGRGGRAAGAGFHEYRDGTRAGLWPGLREHFGDGTRPPLRDLSERLLFAEALETVRLLDEGVLRSVADANVGSLLGIGFPAWTGGALQYVNGYPGGLPGFVDRARELAERYGERFAPPPGLLERASRGGRFTDEDGADGEEGRAGQGRTEDLTRHHPPPAAGRPRSGPDQPGDRL